MYNNDDVKKYFGQSQKFLKDPASLQDINLLREALRFNEYRYYVADDPLISDAEYDVLYKQLEALEKAHPESITAGSPTQRVGPGLIKDFPKVRHLVPMLSLENSYNTEDLLAWDKKNREALGLDEIEYTVEPKYDGASISLVYENDKLVRGVTRGDGEVGDDITANVYQIRNIPQVAAISAFGYEQMEIRGEVMITKKTFAKYNAMLEEQGLATLANPRNAASGSLRIKDSAEVKRRGLEATLYSVSYGLPYEDPRHPQSQQAMLEMLYSLGFRTPKKELYSGKGIASVVGHVGDFEKMRDDLPFEIDGMVIKINDVALQDRLGMTSHHPRWAMAYKFKARQATSRLLSVGYQVGRTGAVTPVAKIAPTQIGGITVTSISIHNEDYIREKDLKINDHILIERSGDVIPQIVKSLPELRDGSQTEIGFPKQCPVCADELYKNTEEAVWRCTNINCRAQVLERMIHFVSKDAMDIRSLGAANVEKFYELGLLKNIPGIFRLDYGAIKGLEGFGAKSVEKLQEAIEASKKQPLHRLIYALGIRFVGENTSKTLARSVKNLMDLKEMNVEKLMSLEDIGVKVATSIHGFFSNDDNIAMLNDLSGLGLNFEKEEAKSAGAGLEGLNFLFTGTLPTLKRDAAEAMVEARGGKILGSVSSKLNYLVVGGDAGSKLEKAKKFPAIHIISEAEFLKLLAE